MLYLLKTGNHSKNSLIDKNRYRIVEDKLYIYDEKDINFEKIEVIYTRL